MASVDHSPRAAKRRKTTAATFTDAYELDVPLPFHSRVLKTVKQVVYGKPKPSKLVDESERRAVSPVKNRRVKSVPTREQWANENRENNALDADEEQVVGRSVDTAKRSNGIATNEADARAKDDSKKHTESLIQKKRKKHKGYVWLDEVKDLVQKEDKDDAGQDDSMHANMDAGGDVMKQVATSSACNAEGLRRTRGRWARKPRVDVAHGELSRYRDAVVMPASRPMEERQAEDNRAAKYDLLPRYIPLQNNGIQPGCNAAVKGRAADRLSFPGKEGFHTHEGNSKIVDATDILAPRKSQGYRARQRISENIIAQDGEDGGDGDFGNSSDKGDSPDELGRDGHEERSKVAESPMSKGKKKRGKAVPPATSKESLYLVDQDPTPPEPCHDNSEDPSEPYSSELQQLLSQDPEALGRLKRHILSGLTGERRLPLVNLSSSYQKVYQLVSQTVLAGEGNSMLIIGARGSGKTTLVETVISELANDHQEDFHVVRLNGFVHTDDKIALREIWRQLGREMDVENDDAGCRSNYADTLASILALLSHTTSSEEGTATAKSILLILDEFDLFTTHPRQTLLYNLFDMAQSHSAPIAVLGLTTKLSVTDALEKRVKSRFGQRYVHLPPPKTLAEFKEICLAGLSYYPMSRDLLKAKSESRLAKVWNAYVTNLLSTPQITSHLQRIYTSTKSIPAFLSSVFISISTFPPTALPVSISFNLQNTLSPPDSPVSLLPTLSTIQLSLLIAAARLEVIFETSFSEWGMVYEEYISLAFKGKFTGQMGGTRVWSKGVARGAWEGLVGLGLVVPAGGAGRGSAYVVDVGLEEIGIALDEYRGGMGLGNMGKWCREI